MDELGASCFDTTKVYVVMMPGCNHLCWQLRAERGSYVFLKYSQVAVNGFRCCRCGPPQHDDDADEGNYFKMLCSRRPRPC